MSINHLLRQQGSTTIRTYRHAARIFTDSNFRLSPKYGFLYYVEFDLNKDITSISNLQAQEMGMIVKSVNLPKFTMQVKEHNAYNRKNYVQNKITYDPVNIVFHDDQADNVRSFWYDYYSFYYRDPDYADSTYTASHKYQSRPTFNWGYTPRPTVGYNNAYGNQPYQYILAIRIYSLYQKNFSEYELINPIITKFGHGEHNASEGQSLLENSMSIQFETVKYLTGYVTENTVGGFIDLHYDRTNSPIAPNEGVNIIDNGQGGYTQATDKITDLAINAATYVQLAPPLFTPLGIVGPGAFSTQLGNGVQASVVNGISNSGGFAIPSLGGLTNGLTAGAVLSQQLTAATASIAGTITSQATNAVVGGIAKGLGPNGSAIVGLVAQAIANPKLALVTVENMAISYAVNQISSKIISSTGTFFTGLGNDIANSAFLKSITDNVTTPISNWWSTTIFNPSNWFTPASTTTSSIVPNLDVAAFELGGGAGAVVLSDTPSIASTIFEA